MLVLALDTATTELVVGVVDVDTRTAQVRVRAESVEETRAHNERLVPTAERLLGEAGCTFSDLDAIVVGCGPGPFTGLRVGMASASAFGQALGIPVHGVVTHDAIAALIDAPSALVATDARRREVYWAAYRDGERVVGPAVSAPAAVAGELECAGFALPVAVLSVPAALREQLAVDANEVRSVSPRVEGLVRAADLEGQPAPLVPHYLRRPDAVEPKAAPRSPAIPDVAL